MQCSNKDIQELLLLFREGALEQAGQARVEAHLAVCADCRAELELLRMIADEPVPDPGNAFWDGMPTRVYQQVREQKTRRKRWNLTAIMQGLMGHRVAWATASALIVSALAWLLLAPPSEQRADTAALSQPSLSAEEASSYETMDIAALGTDEFESIGNWAEQKMAAVAAETDAVTTHGKQTELYEELAEMDGASLKRLSTMLDGMKGRG